MTQMNLRGLVVSKFGSATKMAEYIGWSGMKARDIVSGRRAPRAQDIEKISVALGIETASDFVSLFFPEQSKNWTL